ncbi:MULTISPECIES: hypothetical protein [Lactococcus]|uniref:Uncharacterized protein n=1 Tax=Lactococcus garvieae TaxID=1363 RepID=A0AAX3NCJ7_9LACT|nr:hypothetical protein [Lactococcus garvieae]WEA14144.1 hypothetical protein PWF74_01265 [Lactococcus garvieae]
MNHITKINNINQLFEEAKKYAIENNIKSIVIFAKGIENVINLNNMLKDTGIKLFVTTFPSNQVLYLENEEGELEESYPEILIPENINVLEKEGISLISSTLPLEPIITPGIKDNPYSIINMTLNLFSEGTSLAVQSALMPVDNGYIAPSTRVLSLTSNLAVDLETTNSRFLFHPEKGLKINHIIK